MATAKMKEPTYELELSDEEARYLKGLLQNDLTEFETGYQCGIRENVFNALKKCLPEYGIR